MTEIIESQNLEFKRREGESILEFTQRIRQATVEDMTSSGLPTEEKELYVLATYLDAMDKQEVAKQKIANEEKATETDRMATAIVASMLGKLGNHNPFVLEETTGKIVDHDSVTLPQVDLVPGELDHNQRVINYENFVAEYREKHPKVTDDND